MLHLIKTCTVGVALLSAVVFNVLFGALFTPLCVILACFLSFSVELDWAEGRPCREGGRGIRSSFTHLKIKHLTGSSACVSSSLTIARKTRSRTLRSCLIQQPRSRGIYPLRSSEMDARFWRHQRKVFVTWLRANTESHSQPPQTLRMQIEAEEMFAFVCFPLCQDHSSASKAQRNAHSGVILIWTSISAELV